jgi:hypothetical protein
MHQRDVAANRRVGRFVVFVRAREASLTKKIG